MTKRFSSIALSVPAILLAFFAHAQPSLSPKTDLATLNCRSLFEMKRIETVMVLAWLQRHYAPSQGAAVLDQEKIFEMALKLNEFCESNPDRTVIQAADSLYGTR